MKCIVVVLLIIAFSDVEAQEFTSQPIKSSKQPQSYQNYYPPFKPGSSYKVIPPLYNPSDVSFNPNYYGFMNTGGISNMCPVPQPNYYYSPNAQPSPVPYPVAAWPPNYPYNPWTWNNYPYTGSPIQASPSTDTSHLDYHFNSNHASTSQNDNLKNETYKTTKPIKITRPTMSVKIVPPTFNENATSITNMVPKSEMGEPHNTKLDDKTRKMIKNLLNMASKLGKSDESRNTFTRTDQKAESNEEMVISPAQEKSSNVYPLPKTVYGDKNEPTSSFDRMKIFTEFNPA